jgi:subtilisin
MSGLAWKEPSVMRSRLPLLLAIVAALAISRTAEAQAPADVIPDQYIIVLRDDVVDTPSVAGEILQRFGGVSVSHIYQHALNGFAAHLPRQAVALLRADPRVLFVAEDRVMRIAAQELPTGIDRIEGDLSSARPGSGRTVNVPVAIIDTGIQSSHPDLNVVGGKNCTTEASFEDGNGHGTHVAGTVAAKDNGIGVVGVAPGAPLYAVKVLDSGGSGSTSSVVCGIDWVTANAAGLGIKVANMSLGGSGFDDGNCGNLFGDAMHRAICNSVNAGVTYVVAAGNSNANFSSFFGFVPASYDEVLTVTAVADFNGAPGGGAAATCRSDVDDTNADFSNFTTTTSNDRNHTIAGPGVCIKSTWIGSGYNTISGTSMATPHVTGAAALCIAGPCAGMTPAQVRSKLRADAAARDSGNAYGFQGDPNSTNTNRYYGYLVYVGGY